MNKCYSDYPEGTIFIEIQGNYDGWSIAKLPDGQLINRWDKTDRFYKIAQEHIEAMKEELA